MTQECPECNILCSSEVSFSKTLSIMYFILHFNEASPPKLIYTCLELMKSIIILLMYGKLCPECNAFKTFGTLTTYRSHYLQCGVMVFDCDIMVFNSRLKHNVIVFCCWDTVFFWWMLQILRLIICCEKHKECHRQCFCCVLFLHTCHPYLTLWDKISQNLAHLEANSHKIFKSHRIFRPL